MKLYFHPISSYSQKVLIALYENATAFEPEIIDLMNPESMAKYKEIYPLGKVPLLELDDGYRIPESSIIIEYLSQHHSGPTTLIPADPDEARRTRFMDRACDLYLNDPMSTMFFDSRKPVEQREPARVAKAKDYVEISYAYLEQTLADRPWLMGDSFSMADCAAAPPLVYLGLIPGCDPAGHPNIAAYLQRVKERPSFARVLAEAAPYLEKMFAAS